MSTRAHALADRLERGAAELATFAAGLTAREWQTRLPKDGRKIGVVVHHVATMYPLEIQLARSVAQGSPVEGVTYDDVAKINAAHAEEFDRVTVDQALVLLLKNSADAAAAIRTFTDEQLDRAAPVSLNENAPLTSQFVLEDHAVRHSYHHLWGMRAALAQLGAPTPNSRADRVPVEA